MSHEQLIELTKRHLAHAQAGTVDQAPGVLRIPAHHYTDSDRWQLEVELIFKRLPLALAFSSELRENHAYRALEVCGVPVLLVRNGQGKMRAFVNMCSHRGSQLVGEGRGQAIDVLRKLSAALGVGAFGR